MYKHILLPTDGSPLSGNAVCEGIAFAKVIGAEVLGIHVTQPLHVFAVYPDMVTDTEGMHDVAEAVAVNALSSIENRARENGVDFRGIHAFGERPWEEIIKTAEAENCDLIVMASHGRKGVTGILLGSETQKVLTHTKIPVLVIR